MQQGGWLGGPRQEHPCLRQQQGQARARQRERHPQGRQGRGPRGRHRHLGHYRGQVKQPGRRLGRKQQEPPQQRQPQGQGGALGKSERQAGQQGEPQTGERQPRRSPGRKRRGQEPPWKSPSQARTPYPLHYPAPPWSDLLCRRAGWGGKGWEGWRRGCLAARPPRHQRSERCLGGSGCPPHSRRRECGPLARHAHQVEAPHTRAPHLRGPRRAGLRERPAPRCQVA